MSMRFSPRHVVGSALGVLAAMGLCACATDPFEPLAQALLEPKEARSSNGAEQARGRTERDKETCSEITQIVPTDVDTAYARVMQRLRFRTLDERKRFAERQSAGLIDEGFRHTAQPGAYYRLADLVGWQNVGQAREAAWLEVELSRDGSTRTRFVGRYCLSTSDPHYRDDAFRASLERRLRDSAR
jgi:hypothetical protein